jgi:hypothetical protein
MFTKGGVIGVSYQLVKHEDGPWELDLNTGLLGFQPMGRRKPVRGDLLVGPEVGSTSAKLRLS